MKRWLAIVALGLSFGAVGGTLEDGFANIPAAAKPHVWWHWMNGNVTKAGITADLEAMAKVGIGGAQIFDAGCAVPPGSLRFNTPDWFEYLTYAAKEARRLGIELCLPNCSGWSSSGGPWNPPENQMKTVDWTITEITGGVKVERTLPLPKETHGFYEDIGVFAVSQTDAHSPTGRTARLSRLPERTLSRLDFGQGYGFEDTEDDPNSPAPQSIDVTACMKKDGSFVWNAPAGRWKIYRIGCRGTGKCNHPASYGGKGFEVDKLDAKALDFHFEAYVAKLMKRLGPLGGNVESGLNNILVDSYEVGPQNWAKGFRETFEARAGYDLWRYLPVICGEVVDGLETSDRFLWDYRRVLCDLFAENYAHALRRKCHEYGLKFSLEGYGTGNSDDLQYGRYCDVPMAEFWAAADDFSGGAGNSKNAASICHVWGQSIAAAESFTGEPTIARGWTKTPFGLKAQGDRVFASGVNRIVYHRYAMQPWREEVRPGMTMGRWGVHFERTLTWWGHGAAEWLAYQGRCQYLLQAGRPVVSTLLYAGEDVPNAAAVGYMPKGYWWDAITTDALGELKVVDGRIVAPSGNAFDLLVLATNDRAMTPGTLAKLETLAAAGAKISGERAPVKARGLGNRPASDRIVAERAAKLWGRGVFKGTREEAVAHFGIAADVTWDDAAGELVFMHRRYDDGTEGYFVARPQDGEKTVVCSFAVARGRPELWDAEDGTRVRAADWRRVGDRTEVTLRFTPAKSWFVMFRPKEDVSLPVERPFVPAKATEVTGVWKLSVPVLPPAGAKPTGRTVELALEKPVDWSKSADEEVKYFSGTAIYEAPRIPADAFGSGRAYLDLGEVHDLAEVWLDGEKLATLWRPPYRVELPRKAAAGKLVVKVTNAWPNRLIGDERQYAPDVTWGNAEDRDGVASIPDWVWNGGVSPTGRRCFTTWRHWTAKDELLPAGLVGPVRVLCDR